MNTVSQIPQSLVCLALCALSAAAQTGVSGQLAPVPLPDGIDLAQSFSFRMQVRIDGSAPGELPTIASNKAWESGEVRDYTTNNAYGIGRESGKDAGFAISVLPDGAWTWNAGDGSRRIDHRPERADQGIADGEWHDLGFAIDREMGVAHLYHDGRRVALHDLQGVEGLSSDQRAITLGESSWIKIRNVRLDAHAVLPQAVASEYEAQLGEPRRPNPAADWDGRPLKVLAWNIWHGGRRKGRDEGVQRVVEIIQESGADIVLM